MPSPTITTAEIADLLGIRPRTFQRKRRALQAAGFPRPLPGAGLIWSRRLVDLWIATNGVGQPIDSEASLDPISAMRDALEARIGERAA